MEIELIILSFAKISKIGNFLTSLARQKEYKYTVLEMWGEITYEIEPTIKNNCYSCRQKTFLSYLSLILMSVHLFKL